MSKKKEKKDLVKKNWTARFSVRGRVRLSKYTYTLDQESQNKGWISNKLNLGIYCGPEIGTVYTKAWGGYSGQGESTIWVHGKDEDGRDDFKNFYQIDWEDRFDKSVLNELGDLCFKTVAIEKDVHGKLVQERFLSEYDMIAYLNENLTDDMCVSISGNLEWQMHNGTLYLNKNITNMYLVEDDPDKYHATFTQTMLITKDSFGELDKDKGIYYIDAYVLEKFKEFNGHNLCDKAHPKGQFVPLQYTFEYEPPADKTKAVKAIKALFKPKKGVTQITFNGDFVCSGATIQASLDDVPDDIKEMIEMGIYDEDEVLAQCADNGSTENRCLLRSPKINKVVQNDGETKTLVPQIFPNEYEDEDLELDFLNEGFMDIDEDAGEEIPFPDDDDDGDLDLDEMLKDL